MLISRHVKNNYNTSLKRIKSDYTSICIKTCTNARWATSVIYGQWTNECTNHKGITANRSWSSTSKCNRTSCAHEIGHTLKHLPSDTTNLIPITSNKQQKIQAPPPSPKRKKLKLPRCMLPHSWGWINNGSLLQTIQKVLSVFFFFLFALDLIHDA